MKIIKPGRREIVTYTEFYTGYCMTCGCEFELEQREISFPNRIAYCPNCGDACPINTGNIARVEKMTSIYRGGEREISVSDVDLNMYKPQRRLWR